MLWMFTSTRLRLEALKCMEKLGLNYLGGSQDSLSAFKAALEEHTLFILTDQNGKFTYANQKFCALSQYTITELLGQESRHILFDNGPKHLAHDICECVKGGGIWKGEVRSFAKDGSTYWLQTTVSPFSNVDGVVEEFIIIGTDITELKSLLQALWDSKERLLQAAELAELGVWEWDVHLGIVRWDRRMFEIYGLPELEDGKVTYEAWRNCLHPEDVAQQEDLLGQLVAAGGRMQREFRILRRTDGSVRHIEATEKLVPAGEAAPGKFRILWGTDGTVRHIESSESVVAGRSVENCRVVGFNLDVTERKRTEAEIRQLNLVLLQRGNRLEEVNRELEAFSYSVSHDLRAPLRAIDGFSRMVVEDYGDKLDEEGRRKLLVIQSEAKRMSSLIDDLLAFSRMSRQEIQTSRIDMHALAKEVFDELSQRVPARKLQFLLHPLSEACATPNMIRQVWVNLIGNAIKFTQRQAVAEIEIGELPGEDGLPVYFVKDNGVGFDMRYADKLFGVFQRLHGDKDFDGTGVGLAFVQRIIHRHGGKIWADAKLGGGATFFFTLPASIL
jgi:PAS domain S-box-containing protein